ncbi:Mitochondrial ATPase complex subunit atp10 [Malassezia equina]|uniref:Mitochondrial ATPase complex subunit atp10 n=1 Tax=Malassezia equina TaxID=1381935 RepID=A0AAF0EDA8_9BASI|nr:Mitochondrial ATPase complex subunit atp10 [Malassezia equina]
MLRVGKARAPFVQRFLTQHPRTLGAVRLLSSSNDKGANSGPGQTSPTSTERGTQRPDPPFTKSVSEAAVASNAEPLPFLSQPLGVPKRPTSDDLSWSEKHAEWFNRDARLAKRKMIIKEATRGYFHDFHEIRSHGGKTWRSPSTMIRADKALYFPNVTGTCLADKSKKYTADMLYDRVSIVAMLTSKVSEVGTTTRAHVQEHTRSFYEAALERFRDHPRFQLVQINLQENTLKAYLLTLFVSSLRAHIPNELQATYLLSHQNMDLVREAMGLHNKHVGYTYLVGPDGKIRWAGSAFAEPDEARALVACTGVLLDRLRGGRA